MTASKPPIISPPPRRVWAAEQLGLSTDRSAEFSAVDARRKFQRMLVDAEFVPPDAWRAAFDEATGREHAGAAPEAFVADRELQIRAEVETFARQLFQLEPAERQTRYDVLSRNCADFPRLSVRLNGLTPCLFVDVNQFSSEAPLLRQLAGQVARLAVLKPLDRAVAREAMIRDAVAIMQSVELSARTLKMTRPEIASLAPDLIDELIHYRETRQDLIAARRLPPAKRATTPARPQPPNAGRRRGLLWGYLVLVVVAGLLNGIISLNRSTPSPPPYTPSYAPPGYSIPPGFPPPSYPIPDVRPTKTPGDSPDWLPPSPRGTPYFWREEFENLRELKQPTPMPSDPERLPTISSPQSSSPQSSPPQPSLPQPSPLGPPAEQ